jgi:hypothetical protein
MNTTCGCTLGCTHPFALTSVVNLNVIWSHALRVLAGLLNLYGLASFGFGDGAVRHFVGDEVRILNVATGESEQTVARHRVLMADPIPAGVCLDDVLPKSFLRLFVV